MKSIISYFIKYNVSTYIIMLAVLVFGFIGIMNMNSSFFPLSETTIITINVAYPGASPLEIEEGIVLKIEENLKGLPGIDRVTSKSFENFGVITVETLSDYDIDIMLFQVKNAVDRVPSFPAEMEPPIVSKREVRRESISFNVSGDDVPLRTIKEIAREIEADLRALDGVSMIDLNGFPDEEIEIAVHENDLRAFGLSFEEIARAVSAANLLSTGGKIKTSSEEYLIRVNEKGYYAETFENIVIRTDDSGNVIRLKDIANVTDKWSENPDRLYFNGKTAIGFVINSTIEEDLISAADKVVKYIDEFNENHNNVQINVANNSSIVLKQRTDLLLKNGLTGILLVLLMLSIFLKPQLGFWVAVGMPFSFLGMFIFAGYFGTTINVLSLFGMIIVIGILVDDGIVIAENIYHHHEMGKPPIRAAIDGTLEVVPPIFSAILTTLIAFATFFFIEGRMGDFFGQVSTVVILTLSISLVEALIILPSHIAHSSAMHSDGKVYLLNRWGENIMSFLRDRVYLPAIRFFLENKILGLAIPLTLFILTIGGFKGGIIKGTFFPDIASDRVEIKLKMPRGTTEEITQVDAARIEEAIWAVNEDYRESNIFEKDVIRNVIKRIGPETSDATITVNLLAGEERGELKSEEIANAIEAKTGGIEGAESLQFGAGSTMGGKPVSVSLLGNNILELKAAKDELKSALYSDDRLKDIYDNDPEGIKELKITLKENAYLMGLTLRDVIGQVRSGFFGRSVQRFQRGQDEIRVWVRYDLAGRESIKNLDDMRILTPSKARVPFSEIANYEIARGEVAINHLNGRRQITVDASLKTSKTSATDVLDELKVGVVSNILEKYPTVAAVYEGQNREAGKIAKSAKIVLPIVLFMIFIVIAFTFRSLSQPFLLILMVPFAFIGVAWGHWAHDLALNALSILGIIALVGIMVNDGLVLIAKFNSYLKEGVPFEEALIRAGSSRFRAIFLTTITTAVGLAPIIFEKSRQAQFLKPMAISISYGIVIATFLTLLMLPLLLSIVNSAKVYIIWLWEGKKPTREEVESAIKEQKFEFDEDNEELF